MDKSLTETELKKMIFRTYIDDDEWEQEQIADGDRKGSTREISKEFRLKYTRLCEGKLNQFLINLKIFYLI
jgi:hypothetical protein